MKKILHISVLILSLVTLIGCDSGGGSDSISKNSAGYPDVAGHYSFNTSVFDGDCSDGSGGTKPALAMNMDVFQNTNEITMINSATKTTGDMPGLTVLETTGTSGNVQKDSSFIINQNSTALVDGFDGIVNMEYNITGSFSNNGWKGKYEMTIYFPGSGWCRYTSNFTGEKIDRITGAMMDADNSLDVNALLDIDDPFCIISMAIGLDN